MEATHIRKSTPVTPKKKSSAKVDFSMQSDKLALLNLLLERSESTLEDIVKAAATRFINSNLDLLSEEEKRQFASLFFNGDPKGNGGK